MSSRLPSVRITPEDVIIFCKKRGQKPSSEDAEHWLANHKKTIEGMMSIVIEQHLDEILDEATLRSYPDPPFDKQYKAVDDALMNACEDYAVTIGKEYYGSSHTEAEMVEVVRRMLVQQNHFSACIACGQEFGKPFKNIDDRVVTHRTRRAHITSENGKVSAELVIGDKCDHEHDVFVPEKLRSFH
jgi:hypothetical protein